jgi:hypothetical protein
MNTLRLLFAVGAALMVAACGGSPERTGGNGMEIEEIGRGSFSQIQAERMEVIRDASDFRSVWRQAGRRGEAPEIDFDREMVAAVFMGERRTGGYSIAVEKVEQIGSGVLLHVLLREPGPDCMTTQALTQPWQIVRLPRVEGEVDFHIRQETVEC